MLNSLQHNQQRMKTSGWLVVACGLLYAVEIGTSSWSFASGAQPHPAPSERHPQAVSVPEDLHCDWRTHAKCAGTYTIAGTRIQYDPTFGSERHSNVKFGFAPVSMDCSICTEDLFTVVRHGTGTDGSIIHHSSPKYSEGVFIQDGHRIYFMNHADDTYSFTDSWDDSWLLQTSDAASMMLIPALCARALPAEWCSLFSCTRNRRADGDLLLTLFPRIDRLWRRGPDGDSCRWILHPDIVQVIVDKNSHMPRAIRITKTDGGRDMYVFSDHGSWTGSNRVRQNLEKHVSEYKSAAR